MNKKNKEPATASVFDVFGSNVSLKQHILDPALDGVVMSDMSGRIIYANKAFEEMWGVSKDNNVVGQTISEIFGKQEDGHDMYQSLLADGALSAELTVKNLKGHELVVKLAAHVVQDTDNKPVCLMLSVVDVSNERRLLDELQEIKTTLDLARDCIFSFEPESLSFTYVNEGATRQVGYSYDELMNMTPVDIKPFYGEEEFRDLLKPLLAGQKPVLVFETIHQHKEGHYVPVEIVLQYVQPVKGKARFVAVVRDITERKKTEEELERYRTHLEELIEVRAGELKSALYQAEQANQAKTEFLSRMSHELRTPLNAILGFAQLIDISEASGLSYAEKQDVSEIVKSAQHLLDLINQVLDFSLIEQNKEKLKKVAVPLHSTIQNSVSLVKAELAKRQISIKVEAEECDGLAVVADALRVKQVLVNLLSNAIKYNRKGGEVFLRCSRQAGDYIRITVSDTGIGIAESDLGKLFKPFERFGKDRFAIDGAGIGLALSKRFIDLMDGEIGVESEYGKGSSFWIELPSVSADQTLQGAKEDSQELDNAKQFSASTVLCIEDNFANARLIERLFQSQSNVRCIMAVTGADGLKYAEKYSPDLVLLDIQLPDVNGFEVLEKLKIMSDGRLPVIAVSANALPSEIEKGFERGFAEYITKPINVTRFLSIVKKYL